MSAPFELRTARYFNPSLVGVPGLAVGITLGDPPPGLRYQVAATVRTLAPTRSMWGRPREEFTRLYRAHLDRNAGTIRRLLQEEADRAIPNAPPTAGPVSITLLCFEDIRDGKLCHRRVFADWWQERTGQVVPEVPEPERATSEPQAKVSQPLLPFRSEA